MSGTVVQVDFRGDTIFAVETDGDVLIAVKPIVERLGLRWGSQWNRLQREVILAEGISIMKIPSPGGVQETVCLPLRLMPGFLFGIDDSRVKPELREAVLAYKRECYDALYRRFFGGPMQGAHSHPALLGFEPMPEGLSRSDQNRWLATVGAHDAAIAKLRHLESRKGAAMTAAGEPGEVGLPPVRFPFGSWEAVVQRRDPFTGQVLMARVRRWVDPDAEGLRWVAHPGERGTWRWPDEDDDGVRRPAAEGASR